MTLSQQPGAIPGVYTVLAASSTNVCGHVGRAGDYLEEVVLTAGSSTPGTVVISDGTGTGSVTLLSVPAGTSTVLPYTVTIPVRAYSAASGSALTNQGWTVTLGGSISGYAVGQFS